MPSIGGFFIDYNPANGEPFVGFVHNGDGISVQMFLADKLSAKETEKAFCKAIAMLMQTDRKSDLIIMKGADDAGLRNPQGRVVNGAGTPRKTRAR